MPRHPLLSERQTAPVTLFSLPDELHLEISSWLDYPSHVALSQTSSFFRSIIEEEKPTTLELKLLYLFAAERWKRYDGYFACSRCLKLRMRDDFGDKQRKAKRGKGKPESNRRFCLDCGAKYMLYQSGQRIESSERDYFACGLCLRIIRSGLYCMTCGGCQRCLESFMIRRNNRLGITTEHDHEEGKCFRCGKGYVNL